MENLHGPVAFKNVYSVCLLVRNILGLRYRSIGEFVPSANDHTHRDLDSTEIVKLFPPRHPRLEDFVNNDSFSVSSRRQHSHILTAEPVEVGTQFSKRAFSRECLWVRLHESLDVLVHLLLQFFLLFLLFLAMFAIPEISLSIPPRQRYVQSLLCRRQLEPAVDHPGLSFRDKFGATLQHFSSMPSPSTETVKFCSITSFIALLPSTSVKAELMKSPLVRTFAS